MANPVVAAVLDFLIKSIHPVSCVNTFPSHTLTHKPNYFIWSHTDRCGELGFECHPKCVVDISSVLWSWCGNRLYRQHGSELEYIIHTFVCKQERKNVGLCVCLFGQANLYSHCNISELTLSSIFSPTAWPCAWNWWDFTRAFGEHDNLAATSTKWHALNCTHPVDTHRLHISHWVHTHTIHRHSSKQCNQANDEFSATG